MEEYAEIAYSVSDHVAYLELNKPETMNAMTPSMVAELHDALEKADRDPQVRVVVLTGDIGSADESAPDVMGPIDPRGRSIEEYLDYWYHWDRSSVENTMKLWRMDKPVIAAVQGYVMGGGFWYQLACDITIAAENAVFGQPEVRHVSNTTYLFAALAGWKNASRYSLTGDPFDATEALRMGVVNEVVPTERLLESAKQLADRIALVPPASVRINKAITMAGLQASGVANGMMVNGILSGLAHSLHGPDREELLDVQRAGGFRSFLKARDGKFLPEPFGPKSGPRVAP
jgi:enoyl-CoA hydratase